jgi:hypothetical protein
MTAVRFISIAMLCGLLLSLGPREAGAAAAAPEPGIVAYLQKRLDLNETQVRGALGALLVYARDRLPEPEFAALTTRVPNADNMMEDVKLKGIVTRPLDDVDAYEQALATLEIPQPVAAKLVQGVLDYLDESGYAEEHDILYKVIH